MYKKWRLISFVSLILLLTACSHYYEAPSSKTNLLKIPESFYKDADKNGKPVFKVNAARSIVMIRVYRAGTLKQLGHDHVVASHNLTGYILLPDQAKGVADFLVPLDSLSVDEQNLRTQLGFMTTPTKADIDGTRQHMLDNTLESGNYPLAYIHADGFITNQTVNVQLTLHGITRQYPVAIKHHKNVDGSMVFNGGFTIKQTDFGITPYSVMGGLLQVQDSVDVTFTINAAAFHE